MFNKSKTLPLTKEKYLLLKVYSRSGSLVLVILTYLYFIDKVDVSWIHTIRTPPAR